MPTVYVLEIHALICNKYDEHARMDRIGNRDLILRQSLQ